MTISKTRHMMWRTADGRGVKLMDMELFHLVNVINWINDNADAYSPHVLEAMIEEANYRKVFLFAEGKEYPQKIGDRWKVIDPQTGTGKIRKPPKEYIEAVKDNDIYQSMAKRTQAKRKARQ